MSFELFNLDRSIPLNNVRIEGLEAITNSNFFVEKANFVITFASKTSHPRALLKPEGWVKEGTFRKKTFRFECPLSFGLRVRGFR
jgi:hypothetical protein